MSNSGSSDDEGAWPEELFRKMQEGHENFMRDLQQRPTSETQIARSTSNEQSPSDPSDKTGLLDVFKGFVDTTAAGFNDLAKNITDFPSNIAELRSKMQREQQQRQEEEMDGWRRWTGHEASPDHVLLQMERMSPGDKQETLTAAMQLVQESARRNEHVATNNIKALFWEPSRKDPLGLFDMLDFDEANRWLGVEWFKRNSYSPVRLEAHPDACTQGTMWREAFEDLLNATLQKPMASHEQVGERPNGNPQSTLFGPGLDWMLSLQCRGVLPPQLPAFWKQFDLTANRESLRDQIAMYLLQKTQRSGNGTRQDSQFHALVREIATPAPEQSYQPNLASCPMLGASAPETEQDLYDALYAHEQSNEQASKTEHMHDHDKWLEGVYDGTSGYAAPTEWPVDHARQMEELTDALHSLHYEQWPQRRRHDDEVEVTQQTQPENLLSLAEAKVTANAKQNDTRDVTSDRHVALQQQAEALGLDPSSVDEHVPMPRTPIESSNTVPKVDVLSSLTTTHTTRLPDGTVTTKVMLKQRFADGREETQEKVHTYQEAPRTLNDERHEKQDQPHKKGWFWSS